MTHSDLFLEEYDLSPAIMARKILICETRTNEDISKLVWRPTLELLKALQDLKPSHITFLASPPVQKGSICFLDIVGPGNKIAYIATVQTQKRAIEEWERDCRLYSGNSAKIEKLIELGWKRIKRDHNGCHIPLNSSKIDT